MTRKQISQKLMNFSIFFSDNKEIDFIFKTDLGSQSLEKYKDDHINIGEKLLIIIRNEDRFSNNQLEQLADFYNEYINFLISVKELSNIQFINIRDEVSQKFNHFINQMKEKWASIVGLLNDKNLDDIQNENKSIKLEIDRLLKEFKREKHELDIELDETKNIKNSLEQQLNEYKDRYNDINTSVELETQINVFETQAKKNLKDANKWLIGVIISGITLIIILISIYCNLSMPSGLVKSYLEYNTICDTCGEHVLWVDMIRYIFFKLLIISTNIYILSFCVKNYNASMHNKTNNDHRHNSFRAALHFYNTTTSERREEILIKVADAIFTYQKSGYYGKDSEPSNPSIIQSVIEKVSGKAG